MTAGALSGPRVLLRRFREIMRSIGAPEARLTQVVRLVAGTMVAEVCSVYLIRADGDLELFETEGLRREAIGKTRLAAGHGMVGHVAERGTPLRTRDAQGHPAFEYRPETGEERYSSFLGVPIQHAGRVVGVLVVQNKTRTQYSEEEVEVLETIAMVLAEMVASGQLLGADDVAAVARAPSLPFRADGRTLSDIQPLNAKQRVDELARMLGGQGEAARKHAEALLAAQ